jgi:hypothetical protein
MAGAPLLGVPHAGEWGATAIAKNAHRLAGASHVVGRSVGPNAAS